MFFLTVEAKRLASFSFVVFSLPRNISKNGLSLFIELNADTELVS